ncbi:MAG TPA: pentapeptide repeat-containing protein [Candidatus Tectomicrobia bacterium]|nr:pentapeptide repeat-containing protein [Candidatus Tectomicrobia bacterium]
MKRLPTLFSLDHPVPRFLTGLVTVALIFLRIRSRPASQRRRNRPLWGVMGLIVGGMAAITVQFMAQLPGQGELVIVPQWLPRPLNIFRADLKGKWLATVNFRDADAGLVNLEGANLQRANLHGAQLHGVDLQTV